MFFTEGQRMTNYINNILIETKKGREIKMHRDAFMWNAYDIMVEALEFARSKGIVFDESEYSDFLLLYSGRLYKSNQTKKAKEIEKLLEGLQHSHHSILYLSGAACEILNLAEKHSNDKYGEFFKNAAVYAGIAYANELKPQNVFDAAEKVLIATVKLSSQLSEKNFSKYGYIYCYALLEQARNLASYYCETKNSDDKEIALNCYKLIEPYIQRLDNQELTDIYYYETNFFYMYN